jgi:hypothetical protein
MTDNLKPVRCGCGGEAMLYVSPISTLCLLQCESCKIETAFYDTEVEAITAWNKAMSGNVQECAKDARCTERTAKVVVHDVCITVEGTNLHEAEYLCGACKKKVLGGDDYCSHCGARLEWMD